MCPEREGREAQRYSDERSNGSGESAKPNVEYFQSHARQHQRDACLRPARAARRATTKDAKYPALLPVQYAGIYALPKSQRRQSRRGRMADAEHHRRPRFAASTRPGRVLQRNAAGKLKDYLSMGDESRDTSYFLRMYLGCYRAADYLASRPDWDGKILVVTGTSQGGQQMPITAGTVSEDHRHARQRPRLAATRPDRSVGRAAGFPYWSARVPARQTRRRQPSWRPAAISTPTNSARRGSPARRWSRWASSTIPALPAGVPGRGDPTKGPKEILVMVNSNHHGDQRCAETILGAFRTRLRALVKGEPAPVK